MAANNKFDFDSYNTLVKGAPVGLKLHLGVQLIKDVVSSLEYFDNPLESELRTVYSDLKTFHALYKERAKEAAAKKENPSERSSSVDNSTVITPDTVNNMMKMMEQFQRMMGAAAAGNDVVAQSAERSIREIQNGDTQGDAGSLGTGTNG